MLEYDDQTVIEPVEHLTIFNFKRRSNGIGEYLLRVRADKAITIILDFKAISILRALEQQVACHSALSLQNCEISNNRPR